MHDVLGDVPLLVLEHGHDSLAVNDGLYLVDEVGVHGLLDDGLALDHGAQGRRWLVVVPLDVMNDVLVDLTMQDRLHLYHPVVSDGLLHDRCRDVSGLVLKGLLLNATAVEARGVVEGVRCGERGSGVKAACTLRVGAA
jgi:hypothetical protein